MNCSFAPRYSEFAEMVGELDYFKRIQTARPKDKGTPQLKEFTTICGPKENMSGCGACGLMLRTLANNYLEIRYRERYEKAVYTLTTCFPFGIFHAVSVARVTLNMMNQTSDCMVRENHLERPRARNVSSPPP